MSEMERRVISFAGSAIAIQYSGSRIARVIEFLYQHVPPPDDVVPHLTYRAVVRGEMGRIALYRGDCLIHLGDSDGALAELLLGETCRHLAEQSQGGLLFHAAGLAWRDKGLMLPGTMAAGKSTLAAWLLTRGFDYLTDELVFVPHDADTMRTFTRPLGLKRSSRPVLQSQLDFQKQSAHILSSPDCDLICPTVLNPANTPSEPVLRLIIFPRYLPGSDFSLRLLSGAQAGLALMECLVNARNLAEHGFPEIARLARIAPAYRMTYASFDQIGDRVEDLLQWCSERRLDHGATRVQQSYNEPPSFAEGYGHRRRSNGCFHAST